MSDFNVHELFYLTVVQAVYDWLVGVFGTDMKRMRQVKEEMKDNRFMTTLLAFLFDGALPYLMWRRLLRKPPSKENREALNEIYRHYAFRYVSKNKTNYGPLCFHAMYMYENLSEPLQALWCKIYNANLHGHPGRHMALDQPALVNRMLITFV